MATVRDSDISLWLHNKLGTSNDSWTSGSICSQLNSEVLRNIKDCFPELQTQVKLKLLLSFFHIPRRCIEESKPCSSELTMIQDLLASPYIPLSLVKIDSGDDKDLIPPISHKKEWRVELEEIIEVAHVDSELWVSMLAEIMKTFSATGTLNTLIQDNEQNKRMFSDLIGDLKKLVRKQNESGILPLECHYLNKAALTTLVGQQPVSVKHFTLKRKPKSAILRAELLQKSADASANLKKSATPTVPLRSRGMPRKMTDTTPLKGIPSRIPSGGFQSPGPNRPAIPRNPTPRKDGGIKLLDINEQPMAYAQKKRKKQLELEESQANATAAAVAIPGGKKPCMDAGTTPDYALGLVPPPTPGGLPPPTPSPMELPPTPSYAPPPLTPTAAPLTPAPPSVIPAILEPPPTPGAVLTTIIPPANATNIMPPIITTPIQTETIRMEPEPRILKPIITVPKPPEERKFLLSREHFVEAQEIFRTANKVTRPEKALILGFMAGLRDNPCPDLGNVITIKLSEDKSDELPNTIVENHFQMNYDTGEWNVIVKYRECRET